MTATDPTSRPASAETPDAGMLGPAPAKLSPPFGAHALPGWAERLRRMAEAAPSRRAVSVLRRVALMGAGDGPFDVEVFGGQKARLHPRDNRTEKRVLAGTRFWDLEERARLARAMDALAPGEVFHFVDAGANVGMYTLAMRAEAARRGLGFRAVAVEPDPINRKRLAANLAASGADDVLIAACALSDRSGTARFLSDGLANRGEARLDLDAGAIPGEAGFIDVPLRPLREVLAAAGLPRVDAMKMDIEGHEVPALRGLLEGLSPALVPRLIVIETGRDDADGHEALTLLTGAGYALETRTKLNSILTLQGAG